MNFLVIKMGSWADYLISAVKYDSKRHIIQVKQHKDTGGAIGQGEIIDRDTLVDNLQNGLKYTTIFSSDTKWKKGDKVQMLKSQGKIIVRTDNNKVGMDNLKFLTELE